jgi:hypothetical protein
MKTPLVPDTSDVKWILLDSIHELLRFRRGRQITAKNGITPAKKAYECLAVLILSFFFCNEISYTVREIETRSNLQHFLRIRTVPAANDVYRFMSSCRPESITSMTFELLNLVCSNKNRNRIKTVIIDSTAISVDLNWFRKGYTKKDLENLPYN